MPGNVVVGFGNVAIWVGWGRGGRCRPLTFNIADVFALPIEAIFHPTSYVPVPSSGSTTSRRELTGLPCAGRWSLMMLCPPSLSLLGAHGAPRGHSK